jgi:hypothetical protein
MDACTKLFHTKAVQDVVSKNGNPPATCSDSTTIAAVDCAMITRASFGNAWMARVALEVDKEVYHVYAGVKYRAVENRKCDGCAFQIGTVECNSTPPCYDSDKDWSVIWERVNG